MLGIFIQDIGIDLGTANTLIYSAERGIIMNEPSVVAIDSSTGELLAVGSDAKDMSGKSAGRIKVVRPLRNGVIADFDMAKRMLAFYAEKVLRKKGFFTQRRVIVSVPVGADARQRKTVEDTIKNLGVEKVVVMAEPVAAALGAGLNISGSTGCVIVDIGGGTTDIALIALGDIVAGISIPCGGNRMDKAIMQYLKENRNFLISIGMAEAVKINVGCVIPLSDKYEDVYMTVAGKNMETGLPDRISVKPEETMEALREIVEEISAGITEILRKVSPELAVDVCDRGLVLTGGGSMLRGIDRVISQSTGMSVKVSQNALTAVCEGAGKSLSRLDRI